MYFLSAKFVPLIYVSGKTNLFLVISVVIPVFNEEENVKELLPLLDSLSNGFAVEVIVSVGECPGNYNDFISSFDNAVLVAKGRKGRARQMNDGAAVAKGTTLVFLHADVRPPQGFFKDIEETMNQGYQAGFFSYQFDKRSFLLRLNASYTKRDGLFTGGGDQCLFIKKQAFEKLGGFDENQVLMEDFEIFKRLKSRNFRYKIVQNDLIVSARKYERNSYLRVNLINLTLVVLFKMGVAPIKLKWIHQKYLRGDYS